MFPLFDFFAKKRKITPDHVKRQQMTDWINQYRVKHFIFQNKIRHSRVLLIHTPSKGRVLSCAPSQESSKGQHLRRIKTIKIRVILTKTYTVLVNSLEFMTKRKVHWLLLWKVRLFFKNKFKTRNHSHVTGHNVTTRIMSYKANKATN